MQFAALIALISCSSVATAQSLRGSEHSVDRQHDVAVDNDFTFLESARQVSRFVALGLLVHVSGDSHVELSGVSYPYTRPALRTFVARLGTQYHAACGEPMVVTSLTRPADEQPPNASNESVHPAGMAVDLRVSNNRQCRAWLERVLLSMERAGVLEATRERHPPHYHVAVFPDRYASYVAQLTRNAAEVAATESEADAAAPASGPNAADAGDTARYRVRRGDSLWELARRYGTSVEDLREMNGLRNGKVVAGTVLLVPGGAR